MGNAFSEEEHKGEFLEDGFNLEDPNANDKINYGAAAPRCQPKHTEAELVTKKEPEAEQGEEVELSGHKHDLERQNSAASGGDHRGKRPHTNTAQQQQQEQAEEEPKQLSYIQMAKMGYQELVNAIIRPPRAEYKVQYRNETSRGPGERNCTCVLYWFGIVLVFSDGSLGSTSIQLLWKTLYSHGFYLAHQTRIQSRVLSLGTRRASH